MRLGEKKGKVGGGRKRKELSPFKQENEASKKGWWVVAVGCVYGLPVT